MKSKLAVVLLSLFAIAAKAQVLVQPTVEELQQRRRTVFEKIGDGVAILPSAQNVPGYVEFRQSADFFYLTGLEIPDCYLFLDGKSKAEILYLPPRGFSEDWEGANYDTPKSVGRASGIAEVRVLGKKKSSEDLATIIGEGERAIWIEWEPEEIGVNIIDKARPAYDARARHPWERFTMRETAFKKLIEEKFPKCPVKNLSGVLRTMRVVKGPSEIAALRMASEVSALAMKATIAATRPGRFEYELGAVNDFEARVRGAQGPAYNPIVGSGGNSCILHYWRKTRKIEDGDIIVCDAAASYSYYVSDVTRTFPANGKFTPEQKAVYLAVLEAQEEAIKIAGPGVPMHQLESVARAVLRKHALDQYFIHGLSHHVGMAVHDPGGYGTLVEGQVLTIEPGAYITEKNLGVRIEDVILITKDGCEVLSKACPKSIEEIEALMAGSSPK